MFKKLLSISLIFLIAIGGLTCVSSANSFGLKPIYISGHVGEHYQATLGSGITDVFTATLLAVIIVDELTEGKWLNKDGIILHPLTWDLCLYDEGYEVDVSFLKR